MGSFGTGALLFVAGFSYFIWRFNPSFHVPNLNFLLPKKKEEEFVSQDDEEAVKQEWDLNEGAALQNAGGNKLKENKDAQGNLIPADITEGGKLFIDKSISKEVQNTTIAELEPILMEEEDDIEIAQPVVEMVPTKKNIEEFDGELLADLDLEIKDVAKEEVIPVGSINTKYDVTLDLKNYKFPNINLLETHGSEKIVQDPEELELHKNQIIATLKNYDIAIQRIAATVGPTVTLYEIVPAPGVRISRIKNLEDDIALSLAALGIRIIAPIPGKGTIGIEVPNIRKSVVSMKTLLASEKFQSSQYSLPIAIGKKIDNENFIVDLASMPHLLMAGATGQGKSVGLNAILVSLLYKKHPSQLKFVLVDPKKVEVRTDIS